MKIIEVKSKADWQLFHQVPHIVFKNDPNWIANLENDIEDIFTPAKNKTFLNGEAALFVLLNEKGIPQARIAAFIDHERNKSAEYPSGGFGFFQCVENETYAMAILETAEMYLADKGIKIIDGPINFGERDKFWGLLEVGYGKAPIYQEYYHPPYYKDYLEKRGFARHEQVLTFGADVKDVQGERIHKIAERARSRYPFTTRHIDLKDLDTFAEHFKIVYNAAFKDFPYYKPIDTPQILDMLKAAKPIIDPKLICIAYHDNHPVGFCALLPGVNPYFKPAKGKMNWWGILNFLIRFKFARKRILKGAAFGIHKEFQRKGVFSVMVDFLYTPRLLRRYGDVRLSTIRGHNKIMTATIRSLGVQPVVAHYAYRKMVDPAIKHEPFEFMEL